MKNISILLIISLLFIFSSCDDDRKKYVDTENLDCWQCYQEKPYEVPVKLKFTNSSYGYPIRYTIYSGNAFSSEIYTDGYAEATDQNFVILVEPDTKYTAVAEYYVDLKYIHVINDFVVRTEHFKRACDQPCYYIHETECDLILKY